MKKTNRVFPALFSAAVWSLCCAFSGPAVQAQGVTIIPGNPTDRVIRDTDKDGNGNSLGVHTQTTATIGEAVLDADESRYYLPFGELSQEQVDAILAAGDFPNAITLNLSVGARGNVTGLAYEGGVVDLSIDLYGYVNRQTATPAASDFEAEAVLLQSEIITAETFLTTVSGERLYTPVDVTEFVRQEVANGNTVLAFRLQVSQNGLFPNGDGIVNRYTLHTGDHATNKPFLQVVQGTTYEDWKAANFSGADLESEDVSGPGADPRGEGVANLLRYGLALGESGRSGLPPATIVDGRGQLIFHRLAGASDIAVNVESSTDLANWAVLGEGDYVRRSMLPDGRERLVVEAPESAEANARHFFRVKIGVTE